MATRNTTKHFIPLESNPELFTELIHRLGMSKKLAFHDMYTLDDETTKYIPRPTLALVIIVPAPSDYIKLIEEEEEEEEEKDKFPHDLSGDDEDAVFYCQTIGNACGLFAILHAVSNGDTRGFIEPNTHISNLVTKLAPLNRAQRIQVLEQDSQLEEAHASVASRGDTAPPEDATIPAPYAFMAFAKSHKSGKLYQLEGCRKGPVDLGVVLGPDEDLLSGKALGAVKEFVDRAGKGVRFGYSAMALSVTGEEEEV
ncbi:ubiquitin C-terminal hydrolase L3 [Poronia punctata]|nr:ubiquitin C-terminal hydrolase L3 [Poronia punctata]